MNQAIQFLLRHGYAVLFAFVFAEQIGLPVPAVPILLAMGALAGRGQFSFSAALLVAVSFALLAQLRGGPCRVYSSDLRVRVLATGLATYPDATVVCGEVERDPESATTVVNPRVVVEVLSDATEAYDRGQKLDHYRRIPSLAAVVLVSHREPMIEVWERTAEGAWRRGESRIGQTAVIEALPARLVVDEVYLGFRP